jgi:di/tripeptidase
MSIRQVPINPGSLNGVDQSADFALKRRKPFPTGESMTIDAEADRDGGCGLAGDKQAGGAEMIGR